MATSSEPPPRIEDYGLIGDMRTCALVSKTGSIDFLCWPKFDSPSIFARILDTTKASTGYWSIKPRLSSNAVLCKQHYRGSTNILQTKFIHEDGVVDLTDFFALSSRSGNVQFVSQSPTLVRKIECLRGQMPIDIDIDLKPNYASPNARIFPVVTSKGNVTTDTYYESLHFDENVTHDNPPRHYPCFEVLFQHGSGNSPTEYMFSKPSAGERHLHTSLDLLEGQCIYMIMHEKESLDVCYSFQQISDLEHQVGH